MEFWEWCRELRHAYRSSGVEEEPGNTRRAVEESNTSSESSTESGKNRCLVSGQSSKRPVSRPPNTIQEEGFSGFVKIKEDVSDVATKTIVSGTDSNRGQHSSEEDCLITTAMSGPSPFDVAEDGMFPSLYMPTPESSSVDDAKQTEKECHVLGTDEVKTNETQPIQGKKSNLYSKASTFPTSRLEGIHANKHRLVEKTCPPHGAKSVMGRRAKMEDTFVAIPDLIGIAFANSLNEIIPPRIADQMQQQGGRSLPVSGSEDGGLSLGDSLPVPKQTAASCHSSKGDEIVDEKTPEQIHFFGVFDGHGGADAAHHCKETMHERLKEAILSTCVKNSDVEDLLNPNKLCSSEAFSRALAEAFRVTDEDFAKMGGESEELSLVGTTAVVTLLSSQSMYLANAGDSRAVLYRDGVALALTDDHKAAREDETARVEAAGGQILFWNGVRVMGLLAVSRAIGDHSLRPYVIADPEVTVVNRHPLDELLVMASDGLWDVISNQEACTLAKKCLLRARQKGSSRENAARVAATVLTRAAVDRGSRDNVTVLVIDLMQDPDGMLDADAMKMRLSEEIVAGRDMSSSDDAVEPTRCEKTCDKASRPTETPSEIPVQEDDNVIEPDQDDFDLEMTPNFSFKSPFEMIDPPHTTTE